MSEFFLKIVNMSISASWLVLAVLLLRLVLKKAPKWVSVLLWGFVAVRLICPFSIESVLSLIPSAETISPEIMMDWTPEISTGIGSVDTVVNPIISQSFAPKPYASANPLQILIPVASILWLVGITVMLLYAAVSYFLLRRRVGTAVLLKNNIFQSENVDSPFLLGIIKPKIYLPFQMDGQHLGYVIAHEESHIRRKDHWWKPLGFLLLAVHWFNPLMWLGYILLCRDIELACDEKVIKEMDNENRADYTQALVACSVNRRSIAACPLTFGEVGVKERVKSVMNYKKPALWIIIAAIVICGVVAVCFLTNPSASPEFAMNGNNVRDLDVDTIIGRIQKVEGLGAENAYVNSNNFHLIIDSDFNWVDSQTVRYFFYEGKETHSAQLRIHPAERKYFLTESAEWGEQNKVFLLRHYLDAIKYLPQEAIQQMVPADRYIVRQIEEGTPNNYSRVITYTPYGAEETDNWLIHLQIEPLHATEEGYVGTGDEVIQLFYADANDQVSDINKLISLVSEIANNPDCAASSNPFTYIEARKAQYNEILTYGSAAVDFFVAQLRTGENGLQGYIMAVACADITGIGDKDLGADWATAQEWLALYDKIDKNDFFNSGPLETINGNLKTYYKNTDGTWQVDGRDYKYRLVITGRMPNANVDSTFVYLSNLDTITFQQAWKAAGFSSSTSDYFSVEDAVLVGWRSASEDTQIGQQTEYTPIIDSISYDIDGDGKEEMCTLGYGPTSGLFSFTFIASPIEVTASNPKYSEVFVLGSSYKLSFDITDNVLRIRGDRSLPTDEPIYFGISVRDGHIYLQCEEEGIFFE